MERIPIKKARNGFGDIINHVAYADKTYQITRYGKPIAVIISMNEWEKVQKVITRVKVVD